MFDPAFIIALIALVAPAPSPDGGVVAFAQTTVRQRVIVRVPRMSAPPPVRWKEAKGPKCVPAGALAGALAQPSGALDLVLLGGQRVRAKLKRRCRSINFYSGLYVRPGPDGMVCADRDAVRVRSGERCEIDDFKLLTPLP